MTKFSSKPSYHSKKFYFFHGVLHLAAPRCHTLGAIPKRQAV